MPLSDFSINPPQSDLWDLSGTRKDGETRVGCNCTAGSYRRVDVSNFPLGKIIRSEPEQGVPCFCGVGWFRR